jgi:hypothetical protein
MPESRLVAEMHAGLQHLAHADLCHIVSFGFFRRDSHVANPTFITKAEHPGACDEPRVG